jgi:membrane-associated HD superfamily phosphohydrolase
MSTAKYVALLAIPLIAVMILVVGCQREEEPAPGTPSEAARERAETLEERAQDVREETETTVEGARADLQQARQQFVQTTRTQLAEIENGIKDLQTRQVAFTGDDMQEWTETRSNLNAAIEKVKTQLSDLDRFTGENWQDMQATIKDSMDDLKDKYNDAANWLRDKAQESREETTVPPAPVEPTMTPVEPAPVVPAE